MFIRKRLGLFLPIQIDAALAVLQPQPVHIVILTQCPCTVPPPLLVQLLALLMQHFQLRRTLSCALEAPHSLQLTVLVALHSRLSSASFFLLSYQSRLQRHSSLLYCAQRAHAVSTV